MRVVGYVRVSTSEQQNGPEAQRAELEQWCARNGAELVSVHQDIGVSGGAELEHRPALLRALDELQRGDVLLVAKRDRLARDVMLAAIVERMAERKRAQVVSADGAGNGDSPQDVLMRRMVDAFAEYERAIIRARTKVALQCKKQRGERVGQVPVGHKLASDGVHLERDEQEQKAIALVRELREEGLSIRAIAGELNRLGVQARGSKWHPTTVARLLKRVA